ncbi:MAG TPA: hypothetical protein VGI74_04795 [Streptosporangiaceae bacterium]
MTSLPDWAIWGVALGSPLLNAVVTAVGQRVSRRGDRELETRSRREEVMRTLRWAAELAVSDEVHKARLGNQELKALLRSNMLNSADRDFIFAALDASLEEPVQAIELAGDDVEVVASTTDLSDTGEVLIPSEEES